MRVVLDLVVVVLLVAFAVAWFIEDQPEVALLAIVVAANRTRIMALEGIGK